MHTNPAWLRDELILALDLYMKNPTSTPGKGSAEVAELSRILNELGRKLGQGTEPDYRNPNGVYMKLMNFRRFDPVFIDSGRKGLTRGNKDEQVVWEEFSSDPVRLEKAAAAIRAVLIGGGSLPDVSRYEDEEEGQLEAQEGKLLTRLHRFRERSRTLVLRRKEQALRQHGRLFCQACGFDFQQVYGERGKGFIECHHTKPVHEVQPGEKTRLDDLALLCANCHRMVHAARPWLQVEQMRLLVANNGKS